MNFPSRGLRESAMTIRYVGCFLRPVRRKRILTDTLYSPCRGDGYCSGLLACQAFDWPHPICCWLLVTGYWLSAIGCRLLQPATSNHCLLYTSDAADERSSV